jgi:PPM family protein phosphatase
MGLVTSAGLSDRGRVRPQNDDRWFADASRGLFIVADGMGGGPAGGVAAQLVVDALHSLLEQRMAVGLNLEEPEAVPLVLAILRHLSDRICAETRAQAGLEGMGTTVVMVIVRGERALIAHMGDSRAYLCRNNRMVGLTHDHSLIQLLLDCGEITPDQVADHPARGQLTRFVGMPETSLPEAQIVRLEPGDRLLLCTDGLSTMISDARLLSILCETLEISNACQRLIATANDAGGNDNITALIVALAGFLG